MSLEDVVAKHDSQIGALLACLTEIRNTTKATHSMVVASSVIGPPHRATLGLSLTSLVVSLASLAVAIVAVSR